MKILLILLLSLSCLAQDKYTVVEEKSKMEVQSTEDSLIQYTGTSLLCGSFIGVGIGLFPCIPMYVSTYILNHEREKRKSLEKAIHSHNKKLKNIESNQFVKK